MVLASICVLQFVAALASGPVALQAGAAAGGGEAKTRKFELEMTLAAPDWLKAGGQVRIWAPIPSAGTDQDVAAVGALPEGFRITTEPKYHNKMLYCEGAADHLKLPATVKFAVTRRE